MLEQYYCAKCGEYMNNPVFYAGEYYHKWCRPLTHEEIYDECESEITSDGSDCKLEV